MESWLDPISPGIPCTSQCVNQGAVNTQLVHHDSNHWDYSSYHPKSMPIGLTPASAAWFTCSELKAAFYVYALNWSVSHLCISMRGFCHRDKITWTSLLQAFKSPPTIFGEVPVTDPTTTEHKCISSQYVDDLLVTAKTQEAVIRDQGHPSFALQ